MSAEQIKDMDAISDAEIQSILESANLGIPEKRVVFDYGGKSDRLLEVVRKETSCALCGKLPCGDDISMVLATGRNNGKTMMVQGVCKECQPSTNGQSELKLHYRSYLAMHKLQPRILVVEDGVATPHGAPLPVNTQNP